MLQGGFRSRLTAALVIMAGATTGLLAVTSYVGIREYRQRTFTEHAEQVAELSLLAAPRQLSLSKFNNLLGQFQRSGGFEAVAVADDVVYSSTAALDGGDVPPGLLARGADGTLETAEARIGGEPYLVVAGASPGGAIQVYFFFSRSDVVQSIRQFRNVLVVGWIVAVVVAALFAQRLARRTLRPVGAVADASHSLAEGLLHTRLPPHADDEFGRLAESFNRMAEALEDKIAQLGRAAERERAFTANVAHELRTPLTAMTSAASLLEDQLAHVPESARRPAQLLVGNVRRLRALVLELLELARLDAGQETVELEPLSLDEAISAVVRSWDGEAMVEADVEPGLVVMADRARFKRVLANLVANGLQHAGPGVCMRARREGASVVIEVLDRGPGIAEDDVERVFERFYKSDRARADAGSGLGLAIALENARLQGGGIEAGNRDGGGARFVFRLPAAEQDGGSRVSRADLER
ncbi:MAG: HAMP domain-containing histidine kinase [Actinomycetota bacterium]|nr:HAMP domain-containing histidine kinase [Actinomycetota bacterium]